MEEVRCQGNLAFGMDSHPGLPAQFNQQFHGSGGCRHFDLHKGGQRFDLTLALPPAVKGGVVESVLTDKGGSR